MKIFKKALMVAMMVFFITATVYGVWDKDKPTAGTSLRASIVEMLANDTALETALNREHEFSTGGTVADQAHHKKGSARAYFQDAAPGTRVDGTAFTSEDLGSLWFDTNATPDNLYYVLTATTPTWTLVSTSLIAEMVATANTWGAHQTLGAGYDLLGSTSSDINIGSGNFTVTGATGATVAQSLDIASTVVIVGTIDDDSMAAATDTTLATSESITAYADAAPKAQMKAANVAGAAFDAMTDEGITVANGMKTKVGAITHTTNTNKTITFGVAFTGGCVPVVVAIARTSQDDDCTLEIIAAPTNVSFVVKPNGATYLTHIQWIAVGY